MQNNRSSIVLSGKNEKRKVESEGEINLGYFHNPISSTYLQAGIGAARNWTFM